MKEVSGYYTKEADLLRAVKDLRSSNIKIKDVFSPYPVHGLDKAMGLRRSGIPRVAFIGGATGALSGFLFQAWVFTRAYPINIGGKPFFAVASFIPVTFECTVLFAAFAAVFAYLFRSNLGLGAQNKIYREDATDDKFVVVLKPLKEKDFQTEYIISKFIDTGAMDVKFEND